MFFLFHLSTGKILLLTWRSLIWNCGRVFTSPWWKYTTMSWDLGPNSFWLRNPGKDNSNNKVKTIVVIHVCNDFDIWFWWFRGENIFTFNNMNLECSWEWITILFLCSKFRIGAWLRDKERYVVVVWFETFACHTFLVWL